MSYKSCTTIFLLCMGAACLAVSAVAQTQGEASSTWIQDQNLLASVSHADQAAQQNAIVSVRAEIEHWIASHPDTGLHLAAAPQQPWTAEQTAAQMRIVQDAIGTILNSDPDHPFHLGTVNVNVNATVSALSPMADSVDQTEFAKYNNINAAQAMVNMPGVSLTQQYGGRNQVMVSIHGFNYLQVPLYVDGILMNDPYDSTLDYREIPTTDIAEIQVAKGFSSALIGPNAVGGAINIVTKEPQKKYEGETLIGGSSGDGFLSSIRLGSRLPHVFAEGSLDWTQANFIPLSGNFVTNVLQPGDSMNLSYSHNAKYSGRFGWTPNSRNEYVFSYMNGKAKDGIPLNTGNDPLNGNDCSASTLTASTLYTCLSNTGGRYGYRSWGFWDKTSYYFHSNTGLGDQSSVKLRVFYDQYPNLMYFYNPPGSPPPASPYSLFTPSNIAWSSTTLYDDHADGFSTEFDTRKIRLNSISASFYFKDDTHKEVPKALSTGELPYGVDRQQVASIGLQDVITITESLTATAGMSFEHIDGIHAVNSGNNYYAFVAPQCPSNPASTGETNFSACTPHQWGYNPQVSATYTFKDSSRLFAGFTEKSRFPGLKEMYSFKMGTGIPNPNLLTEHSQNWEAGYTKTFAANTVAQLEFFRSDLSNAIESIPAPSSVEALYPGACSNPNKCSIEENASHETHQGAEFTVHTTPVSRATFDASYTYINKEIDGFAFAGQNITGYPCGTGDYLAVGTGTPTTTTIPDNTCLTPTDLPKNKAVAAATLRLPFNTMLNSRIRYEGGNKAVESYKSGSTYYIETIPMSHFATWDLAASLPEFYKGAALQMGVKNVLDRNYYYVLQYPEEGRNWFINMRYRF